jgi:hypothetical protein
MLIKDGQDYKIGDFVLFDGGGPVFVTLSWLLGIFDKDWRKLKRKPWHVAFISGHDTLGGWKISESLGKSGISERSLLYSKNNYQVFRWFDISLDEKDVAKFIDEYRGQKYDFFFGYLFVILWYFLKWWPLVIDKNWMCWEWLYYFALTFGKPVDSVNHYPLITIIMDKIHYPNY